MFERTGTTAHFLRIAPHTFVFQCSLFCFMLMVYYQNHHPHCERYHCEGVLEDEASFGLGSSPSGLTVCGSHVPSEDQCTNQREQLITSHRLYCMTILAI